MLIYINEKDTAQLQHKVGSLILMIANEPNPESRERYRAHLKDLVGAMHYAGAVTFVPMHNEK